MPRLYFHICVGDRLIEDPIGLELPNLGPSDFEDLDDTRRLVASRIAAAALTGAARLEIADETGAIVCVLSLNDAGT